MQLLILIENSIVSLDIIIWSICIGANIAFLWSSVLKLSVGPMVCKLLECNTEESAKTLNELKENKKFIRFLLKDGKTLRSIVSCSNGNTIPRDEVNKKLNYSEVKFYIEEQNIEKAKGLYGYKFHLWLIPVFILLSVLISVGLVWLVPFIINLF